MTGYHPTGAGDVAPPSLAHQPALCADGICDCGPGLPCGEYLWDHRNQSLRQWLVDELKNPRDRVIFIILMDSMRGRHIPVSLLGAFPF